MTRKIKLLLFALVLFGALVVAVVLALHQKTYLNSEKKYIPVYIKEEYMRNLQAAIDENIADDLFWPEITKRINKSAVVGELLLRHNSHIEISKNLNDFPTKADMQSTRALAFADPILRIYVGKLCFDLLINGEIRSAKPNP